MVLLNLKAVERERLSASKEIKTYCIFEIHPMWRSQNETELDDPGKKLPKFLCNFWFSTNQASEQNILTREKKGAILCNIVQFKFTVFKHLSAVYKHRRNFPNLWKNF